MIDTFRKSLCSGNTPKKNSLRVRHNTTKLKKSAEERKHAVLSNLKPGCSGRTGELPAAKTLKVFNKMRDRKRILKVGILLLSSFSIGWFYMNNYTRNVTEVNVSKNRLELCR